MFFGNILFQIKKLKFKFIMFIYLLSKIDYFSNIKKIYFLYLFNCFNINNLSKKEIYF